MNKQNVVLLILGLCIVSSPLAMAADYDGSVPLLCVPIQEIECKSQGNCQSTTVQSMNLPQFIRVDFKNKRLSGTLEDGNEVTTAIQNSQSIEGKTILQGAENGRGWSVVITEESGKMTASIADEQVAFVLFGACAPLSDKLVKGET